MLFPCLNETIIKLWCEPIDCPEIYTSLVKTSYIIILYFLIYFAVTEPCDVVEIF